jgi:outer membrane protein
MYRLSLLLLLILSPALSAAAAAAAGDILTLSEALEIALAHNPSLRAAEARTSGALEEVKVTRSDFLPKASTQYGYTRLQDAPFQRIDGRERPVGDEDGHHWDITLSQPLFTGFATRSRHQMAKNSAEIEKIAGRQDLVAISQDLRVAWFEALLAGRITEVAEGNVTALQSHRNDAEGFFRQGLISRNDLLKSEAALANALQERERVSAAGTVARSRLANLMGVELAPGRVLEDIADIEPQPLKLQALFEEARQHSPILQGYRLALDNLEQSVILAKSGYYPTLTLAGRYERNGSDPGAATNDFANDDNASIAVTARWDFFEWGRTGAEVAKQKFARQDLAEQVRGIENQLRFDIERAFLDLQVAGNNIGTANLGLEQARENWRITDLQYRNQVATSTEVLDSRSLLSQAESNYYRALYGYRIALAQLERAVGRR